MAAASPRPDGVTHGSNTANNYFALTTGRAEESGNTGLTTGHNFKPQYDQNDITYEGMKEPPLIPLPEPGTMNRADLEPKEFKPSYKSKFHDHVKQEELKLKKEHSDKYSKARE